MRGTSTAALPQLPLLASRDNGTLRRGVLEAEERVGVRLFRVACCCRRSSSQRVAGEAGLEEAGEAGAESARFT